MKRSLSLLLIVWVLFLSACGEPAVTEPEPPAPSEPESPSTSVPEEPDAPTVFNPEAYPRPNEITESGVGKRWTDEEMEYAKSIGFGRSDEDAALYAELADTLNQHLQIAEGNVTFTEEEISTLETALIEAYESSETPHGRWLFAQMCSALYSRYQDYEAAISYGEISLDELWANGEWLEKLRQGEIDVLYMEMVYNAHLAVADTYIQYGDPQKALECYYGIFGVYNQAEVPIPRSNVVFVLEMALSDVQSLLDPSFIAGAEDEAALARAQEAVAIAPELIAMIEADIEEYSA